MPELRSPGAFLQTARPILETTEEPANRQAQGRGGKTTLAPVAARQALAKLQKESTRERCASLRALRPPNCLHQLKILNHTSSASICQFDARVFANKARKRPAPSLALRVSIDGVIDLAHTNPKRKRGASEGRLTHFAGEFYNANRAVCSDQLARARGRKTVLHDPPIVSPARSSRKRGSRACSDGVEADHH